MHFFSQYRGLRRENYVLFFGRIVTNMGSMVWPMLTMILNQKLGMSAGNIAILTAVFGILMMPATLFGGKLADRLNKKNIIIVGDIVSVVCYILCGCVPLGMGTIVLMFVASLFQTIEGPAYNAIIADITPLEERDKAYSLQYWGANLGLVLSPTLSGLLFKNYLWLAFIISGVAIGCSTILIWLFVRDITPVEQIGSRAEYQRARDGESIFAILRPESDDPSVSCRVGAVQRGIRPVRLSHAAGSRAHPRRERRGDLRYGLESQLHRGRFVYPVHHAPFPPRDRYEKAPDGKAAVSGRIYPVPHVPRHDPDVLRRHAHFHLGRDHQYHCRRAVSLRAHPASHRGRINSVSGVAYTILRGVFNIAEGKAYDAYGSSGRPGD